MCNPKSSVRLTHQSCWTTLTKILCSWREKKKKWKWKKQENHSRGIMGRIGSHSFLMAFIIVISFLLSMGIFKFSQFLFLLSIMPILFGMVLSNKGRLFSLSLLSLSFARVAHPAVVFFFYHFHFSTMKKQSLQRQFMFW